MTISNPTRCRFLHTADWQIGKPFHSIKDHSKRESLRAQRLETVRALAGLVREKELEFVLVCGDLFDSHTPDKATVSGLCGVIGQLGVPVYAIPGNHDHAGPGCIWEQDFFLRERKHLCPNLHLLLEPEPVLTDRAVLLPCPLQRRHQHADPLNWLQDLPADLPAGLPRIILAHGSTRGFSSAGEQDNMAAVNRLELDLLPGDAFDYIALGDWHGMKEISPRAWFSGTPEQDRFAKGAQNLPGHVLMVEIDGRHQPPVVTPVRTGRVGWHEPEPFFLSGDGDLDALAGGIEAILGKRTGQDLLKIKVDGSLSFSGRQHFDALISSLEARLLRLELEETLREEPSPEELETLVRRDDPLIASVAGELHAEMRNSSPAEAAEAAAALRELFLLLQKN